MFNSWKTTLNIFNVFILKAQFFPEKNLQTYKWHLKWQKQNNLKVH